MQFFLVSYDNIVELKLCGDLFSLNFVPPAVPKINSLQMPLKVCHYMAVTYNADITNFFFLVNNLPYLFGYKTGFFFPLQNDYK